MEKLTVDLPGRAYDIAIQRGILDEAGERCRAVLPRAERIFLVTDSTVLPLYGERVAESLRRAGFQAVCCAVPAGERSKSSEQLSALWEKMMDAGLTRTDAVTALGGGVVGDLAGFAAATILRGVDFIQIPTTLLAQVDSSVGGKVAVDLRAGKNLAGAFWQPRLVLMDPDVLDTLEDRTFSDGMAEVIKYGCIQDADLFALLDRCGSRAGIMAEIEHILFTCCDLKRRVVVADERDTGGRMVLNFGHTLGHAYEKAGNYTAWTHGQSVAAGMVAAARLGTAADVTPPETAEQIRGLVQKFGLPSCISCTWNFLEEAVGVDKKGAGDQITLVFLARLGEAALVQMKKAEALRLLKGLYGG